MEEEEKDLEVRQFTLEDDLGNIFGDLSLISFVSDPAIQQDYKLFSANKYIFSQHDAEMQIVTGPAMRPNFNILRQEPSTGKYYYGFFTPEDIRKCSEIYLKNNNHTSTNIEHGEVATKNQIDGVCLAESWIVEDPSNDKALALGFKNVQKGDWYISYKIESPSFWKFIKEFGGGFSIEGIFAEKVMTKLSRMSDDEMVEEIRTIVFSNKFTDVEKENQIKILLNLK